MVRIIYVILSLLMVTALLILGWYIFVRQTNEKDFNIAELSGEWWMVAGISPEKTMATCIQYRNVINSSTAWMKVSMTSSRKGGRLELDFKGSVNGSSMILTCPLTSQQNETKVQHEYKILSLDSKYAVIFASSISPKTGEKTSTNFAIVLSRSSEVIPDTQFEIFKKQLSEYFTDMTRYVKVNNTCNDK